MANEEHLARPEQGMAFWNQGRDENHEIRSDLTGVYIGWTTFGNVDLSSVHGLETAQHEGPSTIGIDTLYRSHGNIPDVSLIVSDSDLREAAKRQAVYVTSGMVTVRTKLSVYGKLMRKRLNA